MSLIVKITYLFKFFYLKSLLKVNNRPHTLIYFVEAKSQFDDLEKQNPNYIKILIILIINMYS